MSSYSINVNSLLCNRPSSRCCSEQSRTNMCLLEADILGDKKGDTSKIYNVSGGHDSKGGERAGEESEDLGSVCLCIFSEGLWVFISMSGCVYLYVQWQSLCGFVCLSRGNMCVYSSKSWMLYILLSLVAPPIPCWIELAIADIIVLFLVVLIMFLYFLCLKMFWYLVVF